MELRLVDGIGPFFVPVRRRRLNWSKIPFHDLPVDGEVQPIWSQIARDLEEFARSVKEAGFNAMTLDDVAHLTMHPWYEEKVAVKIAFFSKQFSLLIDMLRELGLRVYVTSDVVTLSKGVADRLGSSKSARRAFYFDVLHRFFEQYPSVEGVILRIGESDGLDVHDDLRSELHLKSAKQANSFLKELLPRAEKMNKTVILRTWTVGAHRIGDLIWRRGTLERLVAGIHSSKFILSMKPGDSDFFRYLSLNDAFHRYAGKKLIELQARPEYEGAGELPTFLGYEYENYCKELSGVENLIGMSVWCQTGGWHRFRRMSFFGEGSPWVELNARIALAIFNEGQSAHQFLMNKGMPETFFRRLDWVIRHGFYLPHYAKQQFFFRRVRIPPLIHVYWDTLFLIAPVRKLMKVFVQDRAGVLEANQRIAKELETLVDEVTELSFPRHDLLFLRDTIEMILLARRYYFEAFSEELVVEIEKAKGRYKKNWPKNGLRTRFRIRTDFQPIHLKRRTMKWGGKVILRRRKAYRFIDYAFVLTLLGFCYRVFTRVKPDAIPSFAKKSAMGIDSLFK